ncbi:MAG: signal peptidase II [Desulfuromonadaceae bacterium]|nr:signal peptidase II [Desulfuromonadaceae bacterium]
MSARFRLLFIITGVVVAFDQITKLYVERNFLLHESVTVIENILDITSVRNQGAAFGILADSSIRRPFFITVSIAAALFILWYIHNLEEGHDFLKIPLSLIFAGALGNLIDRVRLGEVIDFIDVHWHQYHWPAFNVADSAISIGVTILLWCLWRIERKRHLARR